MPTWTFKESFAGEEGAREETSCVSRTVEEDVYDQLWFLVRIMEISTGMPIKQLTVSFEGGKIYSTET